MTHRMVSEMTVSECSNNYYFRVTPLCCVKSMYVCMQMFCSGVRVPTAGEELRPDGGNELALERLGVGTLGVLDHNVPLFDPTQQPLKVAVTQQVRCLKLPVDV